MPGRVSVSGDSVTSEMDAGTSNAGVAMRVAVIVTVCAGASGSCAAHSVPPAAASAAAGQRQHVEWNAFVIIPPS
jgi:hypothetical protein